MASSGSVYRRRRRRRDGSEYQESHYTISYQLHTGDWTTAKGFRDKRASEEKLRELLEREDRQAVGLPVAPLPGDGRSWADAVAAYRADLERQGRTPGYLGTLVQQLADLAAWCKWSRVESMRSDGLTAFLAHVGEKGLARPERPRAPGRRLVPRRPGKPASPRTVNAYRDSAVSFASWCVSQNWLEINPLDRVPKAQVGRPGDLSRRPRARRALLPAEFFQLLACEKIPEHRRRLYEVAGLSGLRGKELNQFAPVDFTLGARPRFHLRPEITKGKRLDTVPMLPECAAALARLIGNRTPLVRLFPVRPHHRTVAADLRRAGIPDRDERGRYANFHSLRYTFCAVLGRVLPIQRVRVLMRHQDIRTTVNLYLDLGIEDLADALGALPPLFEQEKAAAATKGGKENNRDGEKEKRA